MVGFFIPLWSSIIGSQLSLPVGSPREPRVLSDKRYIKDLEIKNFLAENEDMGLSLVSLNHTDTNKAKYAIIETTGTNGVHCNYINDYRFLSNSEARKFLKNFEITNNLDASKLLVNFVLNYKERAIERGVRIIKDENGKTNFKVVCKEERAVEYLPSQAVVNFTDLLIQVFNVMRAKLEEQYAKCGGCSKEKIKKHIQTDEWFLKVKKDFEEAIKKREAELKMSTGSAVKK